MRSPTLSGVDFRECCRRKRRDLPRRFPAGDVEVSVAVDVHGPVVVAVHVHGNDTVIVI